MDEKYSLEGYFPTIGIECHVQLKTKTKLFVAVSNEANEAGQNTLISHLCYGLPGALPVLNEEAVHLAARAAFALGTTPQKFSKFDRKHYFYPDLPLGYQISQFDEPIVLGGSILVVLDDGSRKTINITRAHLEADAGKSTHPTGKDYSLVDFNRVGTPLLEIVSEPEMHSATEAKAFARELWLRMKMAGVSDVDLYHGNMRFDVNVSVSKDPEKLGTRSETKNLNSFKSVERAVDYEINRQIELLESGGVIVQETRGWLDDKQKTVSQRTKEDAHDYRYFPDPDIPPVILDDDYIKSVESELPLMPDELRDKLADVGIDVKSIETLLEFQALDTEDFMQLLLKAGADTNQFANWIINVEAPLMRQIGNHEVTSAYREEVFYEVLALQKSGKLNSNGVKVIIEELLGDPDITENADELAEKLGLVQISDSNEIEMIVRKVLDENPKPVEDIKNGEVKVIGFLVGQVMKESKGKANPAEAQKIIRKLLEL